ncbi:MAG: hypothetical protein KF830_13235 [Planctomycetes bacterium]|nr:hypothetical protein [Planctomycetota bacterium]
MTNPSLPTESLSAASRGQWLDAWLRCQPLLPELMARGELPDLLWLHETSLRLGLDTRRRWLGRTILRRHGGRLVAHTVHVLDLLRAGRLFDAWSAQRGTVPRPADGDEELAWLLARVRVHSELHDHPTAFGLIDEARARFPDRMRTEVEAAWALQLADRTAEALAACRAAIASAPEAPLPRLQECWLLHEIDAPEADERIAALRGTMQSPHLEGTFASRCLEAGDPRTARDVWTSLLQQPVHERRARIVWRIALVRTCRELGDDAAALVHAEAAGPAGADHARRLREHLAVPGPRPRHRTVLQVPFVRQDHMTCSPATMSALLRTFGVHVEQREIAAQITYDGTASHDELAWARERGLEIRFFQFDAEVARTLLDLGLPFAVTTRFETSGHRQAVIGHDRVLDTFLLRDSTGNFRREVPTSWLEGLTKRGGECALLLPREVAAAHPAPPLPLEEATMEWLHVQIDWRAHRHADADRRIAALLALPRSPLRFDVEVRVSGERGDRRRLLELWREAHAAAPDDPYWQYHYAIELQNQNRWQEARQLLEQWAPRSPSPFLRRLLADQWRGDARLRPAAIRTMRRALRHLGRDARSWHRCAAMSWDENRREEAADVFRIATAMAPHDEWLASSYFWALHDLGRAAAGLEFLRERCDRLGGKSPAPAATLAQSLATLHRPGEAIAVLSAALQRNDGAAERQQLFDLLLGQHEHARALELLDAPGWHPVARAMSRHAAARSRGDHAAALAALDECVRIDPWHAVASRLRLEHLLEHEGAATALAAADAIVAEHGESPPLMVAVAEFYERVEDRGRERALLRRLVAEHPHEHWLRGRLARHLLYTGDLPAARPLLTELQQSLPESSALWADVAACEHAAGDVAAARAAARRAFELSPENGTALRRLVDWAPDPAQAAADVRAAMEFVAARPVPPEPLTLDTLRDVARAVPPDEFRAFLDRLERDFPSSPAAAVARCEFELALAPAAALPLAAALVERQPWLTGHRLRHAACLRAGNRRAEERKVLEQLLERDPTCAQAYVELGESLDGEGQLQKAMAVFERGIARVPGYAVLHGMVADAAWRLGARDRALASVARACELDRGYVWAFRTRARWLVELDRHGEALAVAEQLVAANPRWPAGHDLHADVLAALVRHDERVAALRRGLALSPRLGALRDRLVGALVELKRFDEARAAIDEGRALLGDEPRLLLQRAEIERTSGRIVEARQQLRALLARHADFREGWLRYLEWCEEEGRHADVLDLHGKPPSALRDDAVLFAYASTAFRRRGDREAAVHALERALELDPGYHWARDTLCELALEQGRPQRIWDLLPDHADPASLPFRRAVFVAKAAARQRRRDLARSAFARLLGDPEADGTSLAEVDALLRRHDRAAHDETVKALAAGADPTGPVARNHLRILAGRGDFASFWSGLTALHAAAGPDRGDVLAAAVLADVRQRSGAPGTSSWVREHVRGPVRDTGAMGDYLFALPKDEAGSREIVRLFGADWRRPDVQGWMLANLADALLTLRRFDDMVRVCRHALERVPHDHSFWWHRRFLADAELAAGRFDAARALCEMPLDAHRGVRLAAHQIDLLAELRTTPWWRRWRVLRRRGREMFRRYDAAVAEGRADPADLRPVELWRACPGLTTLLLDLGRPGRAIARALCR